MKVLTEEKALELIEKVLQNDKDIKEEIEGKIPSLEDYATEEYVIEKIAEAQLEGTDIDLSSYVTTTEMETYVEEAISNVSFDTSNFVTNENLSTTLEDYAKTEDIPSLEDYATEEYVTTKITEAQLEGSDVDLSTYYTKDEVDGLVEGIEVDSSVSIGEGVELVHGEVTTATSIDNMPLTDAERDYTLGINSSGHVVALEPLPYKKTIYDIRPIPDKYNTGCHGDLTSYLDTGVWTSAPTNGLIYMQKSTLTSNGSNVFENIDFDGVSLYFSKNAESLGYSTIYFKNCRINGLMSDGTRTTHNIQSNVSDVHLIFENCTFNNSKSSVNSDGWITFKNCYADIHSADCYKAYDNVRIINCYAGQGGLSSGAHADGVQFTQGSKFYIDNYRCDAIAIKDVNVYNAGVYIDYESGDVTTLEEGLIQNVYINGGGYTMYLVNSTGYLLDNITIRNAQYGCSYNYGSSRLGGGYESFVENDRYTAATTAYIGSVWKEDGNIKLCVTNYTNEERTLIVVTSNGDTTITIPACPTYSEYYETYTSVSEFPFDLEYSVADADWIVVYDTSRSEKNQIRFVDFRAENITTTSGSTDLSSYATKTEVETMIGEAVNDLNLNVNELVTNEQLTTTLEDYATEEYVTTKITEAQLEGADVDLSTYYTKDEVDELVSNTTSSEQIDYVWDCATVTEYPNKCYKYTTKELVTTGDNYSCFYCEIPSEVKKVRISGANTGSNNRLAYCFIDTDGAAIEYPEFVSGKAYKNLILDVPTSAMAIYVNGNNYVSPNIELAIVDARGDANNLNYLLKDFGRRLQYKDEFAWKPMDTGYIAFTFDDSLDETSAIADLFISKGVPCCFGAVPEKVNMGTSAGETVAQAMKRVIDAVGGEVLAHGSNSEIVISDNIDDMGFLYEKFVVNKQKLIDLGFDVRGCVRVGGDGNICGDARTEEWVKLFFDYCDLYGREEPYNHNRVSVSTEDEYKAAIDEAIANKEFTPMLFHTPPSYLETLIDYAIEQGAKICTYATVYDTFGSTVEEVSILNRLSAIENTLVNVSDGNEVKY